MLHLRKVLRGGNAVIVLTNCLADHADEGSVKTAVELTARLKKLPGITVITYERRSRLSDIHLKLNKLLLGGGLPGILRKKREPVLYIPFPAPMLSTALRIWLLSRFATHGLRVLLVMQGKMGKAADMLIRLSGAEIITLSRQTWAYYHQRIGSRAHYLKAGVDTRRFAPVLPEEKRKLREKYGFRSDEKLLLHVGHLHEGRNIRCLLDVPPQWRVVLAVSTLTAGERDESLRRDLESRSNITIIDSYVQNIEELYQMSDVYFFPVREALHCIDMPLSVLEAAACGVPMVAARYGGLTEFEGDEGFHFLDSFDPEEIARVLDLAAGDPADPRKAVLSHDWDRAIDTLTN